ncbi:MAG: hypothetical protein Tsb0010_00050 [Parvularculaceae bacterium]
MRILKMTAALALGVLMTAFGAAAQSLNPDLFEGMKARSIGPAGMSGRIAAIDVVQSDPNTIYVGAAIGGVWKSTDAGITWTPVFDDMDSSAIGAVAIFQPNPDIVWAGAGEGNVRNSVSVGRGIYKSVDGGVTWRKMGLERTERIYRIIPHPVDPDTVYVAAMGREWGENSERGVYKTTDGGTTWEKILYVNERTGAGELVVDPSNPDHLIAGMWEYRRWPWGFKSGGPGSGVYVTYDGGENWRKQSSADGLPQGELGRTTFAFAPSEPELVYALVEAKDSKLLRSTNGGESWSVVNDDTNIAPRPLYYQDIRVDPERPNRLYRLATNIHVSEDGGRTLSVLMPPLDVHVDNHALWINPKDGRHMIVGNDGGVAISRDRGKTWRFVRNLPLAQYYHIAVDDENPYNVYGGLQDNGAWKGPSESWNLEFPPYFKNYIRNSDWFMTTFGDGFDTIPDPRNSRMGYSMSQGGALVLWNQDTGETTDIRPSAPDGVRLRFNWNAGFAIDPFDPDTIYYGSQFVHKSTDRGRSWEIISEDLTTNDPARQNFDETGGLTPDTSTAENNTTIVAIAPSPLERGVIWIGTDDGRLHITRDGGESWTSLERALPRDAQGAWIEMIYPSPHDAGEAYISITDHRRSNWTPYLIKATNYGRRLQNIGGGIDGFIRSAVQDHVNPNLLFAGSEFGLHVSLNGGQEWFRWTAGVPVVPVKDIAIQRREDDLVIGTHGRAIFIIDDYSSLRDLAASDFSARFKVLDVTDAQQYQPKAANGELFPGTAEFRGETEPYGAVFTWIASGDDLPHPDKDAERARKLAQDAEAALGGDDAPPRPGKVKIEIMDASGEIIRTLEADPHQGVNRTVWNLNVENLDPYPDQTGPNARGPAGPQVPPGDYSARLSFGDIEETVQFRVLPDPRLDYSQEDYEAGFRERMELFETRRALREAVAETIKARSDIDILIKKAEEKASETPDAGDDGDEDNPYKAFVEQAKDARKALTELDELARPKRDQKGFVSTYNDAEPRLGGAMGNISSQLGRPTPAQLSRKRQAMALAEEAIAAIEAYLENDLPALRDSARELGLNLL